jgi:hypothetical protein
MFKKYFASTIQDLFSFLQKGLINSQAVRIRVKLSYKHALYSKKYCLHTTVGVLCYKNIAKSPHSVMFEPQIFWLDHHS